MIYDALDRMIEQTRGSAHTQIVYGPYGIKLALMNGQTLVNAFVKLPGGARAVYNSSGLAFYRHADHLGSSRLATTPSQTKYFDVAYAPYGEDYKASGTTDLSFTDQNQETVTGGGSTNLYDFLMREYRTGHGRWTSPDPAGLGAVDPTDPQSWNRYSYALSNPLAFTDPLGLFVAVYPTCPPGTTWQYLGSSYWGNGCAPPCPSSMGYVIVQGFPACTPPSDNMWIPTSTSQAGCPPGQQCGQGGGTGGGANKTTLNTLQQTKECLDQTYETMPGKVVETLSPLQMVPGFGQDPLFSIGETVVGVTSKAAVVTQTAENAGQPAITTIFSNVGPLAGPLERSLGWLARGTLRFGPLLWVAGAQADLLVHAQCENPSFNAVTDIMP
jgi:RHS repeat-associated protein